MARLPQTLEGLGLEKRYQLIVNTAFDTTLEHAFDDELEPYDLAIYMAKGPDNGRFVHFPYEGAPVSIGVPNNYGKFPIGVDGELERTVIVKIHGAADGNTGHEAALGDEVTRGSTTLHRATLQKLGGAQTIARTHVDRALDDLPQEAREAAIDILHHLITPSGTKSALAASDLAEYTGRPAAESTTLLERLASSDTRIVRPVPPPLDMKAEPGTRSPTTCSPPQSWTGAAGNGQSGWSARRNQPSAWPALKRDARACSAPLLSGPVSFSSSRSLPWSSR